MCNCLGGIIGRICVGLVNVCNVFFCRNGGICIFNNFLLYCVCLEGFISIYCEVDINYCYLYNC